MEKAGRTAGGRITICATEAATGQLNIFRHVSVRAVSSQPYNAVWIAVSVYTATTRKECTVTKNSVLAQLSAMTKIVVDSGDLDAIRETTPVDATTNPSLILKAADNPKYRGVIDAAVAESDGLDDAMDRLAVAFGVQILELVPGRVSTEVDARLSFNTTASIEKARRLIALYEAAGVSRDRVLIKLASTWEGIRAAETLEKEGVHCNLTLLFCMAQAVACAEAGVTLISPFVGRILDWHVKTTGEKYIAATDPGVISVTRIYNYFKQNDFTTTVMGASFRNTGEIIELAGCDALTIAPDLLAELANTESELAVRLSESIAATAERESLPTMTEAAFRWSLNEDAMATEKLAEGIRKFAVDQEKLAVIVTKALESA